MSIHKPSLVLGASLVAACVVALGVSQAPSSLSGPPRAAQPVLTAAGKVTIAGIPTPAQCRSVQQSAPLVVPAGGLFVVTGIGGLDELITNVDVLFDGQVALQVRLFDNAARKAFVSIPAGLVAPAGTTVSTGDKSVIHGYLVRENQTSTFVVDGIPRPDEMVRVLEGAPFVVPSAKRFVATAVGTRASETTADLRVDNVLKLRARIDNTTGYVIPLSPGLTAGPGSTVSVTGNVAASAAVVLGYVVDE